MKTSALVVHQIPGRIRFSIAGKRGDEAYFSALSARFSRHANVRHVRANVRAASILVEYSGPVENILQVATSGDALELEERAMPETRLGSLLAEAPAINLVSGRELSPMFMAGAAFLTVAVIQACRGQVMVPAASAFWYAISVFQQTGVSPAAEPVEAGTA